MEINSEMGNPREQPVNPGQLWFSLAAGPVIWSLHLVVSYALASLSCWTTIFRFSILGVTSIRLLLILLTLILALVVFYAGLLAYRNWGRMRESEPVEDRDSDEEEGRFQFMSFLGIALCALFGAGILLMTGPMIFLRACP